MPSQRFESFDTQSNDPRLAMSVMSFGPADSDAGSWDVLSTKSALAESEAGSWVVLATNSVRGSWKVPHKAESEAGSWVVEKDAADSEDPKGSKGPDDFPEVDPDDKSIYCDNCEMWLRNCDQWKEHFVRKKHKKHEAEFVANSTPSASHKADLSGTTRSTTTRRSAPGGPKFGEPNIQSTRRTHKPVSQTCSGWLDILRGRSKLPAHTCYCEQMNASYYMHEQVHMEEIRWLVFFTFSASGFFKCPPPLGLQK